MGSITIMTNRVPKISSPEKQAINIGKFLEYSRSSLLVAASCVCLAPEFPEKRVSSGATSSVRIRDPLSIVGDETFSKCKSG